MRILIFLSKIWAKKCALYTEKYDMFLLIWQKIDIIFIDLQKNNNSNYLPFLLPSDFLKNQVPILVFKDFWYQEITNQTQLYYVMWPIRCNSITWPIYLGFKTWCSHRKAIVPLAVVRFLSDNLREKSVPLTKQSAIVCFKNSWGAPVKNCWSVIKASGSCYTFTSSLFFEILPLFAYSFLFWTIRAAKWTWGSLSGLCFFRCTKIPS